MQNNTKAAEFRLWDSFFSICRLAPLLLAFLMTSGCSRRDPRAWVCDRVAPIHQRPYVEIAGHILLSSIDAGQITFSFAAAPEGRAIYQEGDQIAFCDGVSEGSWNQRLLDRPVVRPYEPGSRNLTMGIMMTRGHAAIVAAIRELGSDWPSFVMGDRWEWDSSNSGETIVRNRRSDGGAQRFVFDRDGNWIRFEYGDDPHGVIVELAYVRFPNSLPEGTFSPHEFRQ